MSTLADPHRNPLTFALEKTYERMLWLPIAFNELMGTTFITFVFAFVTASPSGMGDPTGTSASGSPIVFASAYWSSLAAIGFISCGYFNPAVTLNNMAMRKIHWKQGLLSIFMQFIGGFLGAGIAYGFNHDGHFRVVPTERNKHISLGHAFGLEVFVMFFLLIFLSVALDGNHPLRKYQLVSYSVFAVINLTLIQTFNPYTGGMYNPAVDVAINVIGYHSIEQGANDENATIPTDDKHWIQKSLVIYFLAPLCSVVSSLLLYYGLYRPTIQVQKREKEAQEDIPYQAMPDDSNNRSKSIISNISEKAPEDD
mmetsp:Transcript_42178/g.48528  ORF Transcript_42178/g.48528 Transcript_42178/m.48528 type:complete len:311 (+) Transcript_42178:33-965(+)